MIYFLGYEVKSLLRNFLSAKIPGANSTTSEFTTTAPALFKVEEYIFIFKTHNATRGVVNFYNAGIVTHDRRIGCRVR
jgi:hypothetical protein